MKEPINAGLVAGAIAVTASGGVGIVADGWPQIALAALAVGSAFGLGGWLADRRIAALVAVVRSFCEEAAVYYRARGDGRIDDAEAREIAEAAGRFFADLETAGTELLEEAPCPTS
ncbi:MAG: hypothetical protein ABFC38_06920 [Methanospirillum sp.]